LHKVRCPYCIITAHPRIIPPDARRPELDDAEQVALAAELRRVIAVDPFPLSPRIRKLRTILAKLEAPAPRPQPFPAAKPAGDPSHVLHKKHPRR
jgi:hypothetical protein